VSYTGGTTQYPVYIGSNLIVCVAGWSAVLVWYAGSGMLGMVCWVWCTGSGVLGSLVC